MKKLLLFIFCLSSLLTNAQAPTIEGDVLLCPWTDGNASITTDMPYDSYQWYYKYWFEEEEPFVPIEGATEASFTYDWYTYDQALLKVVVTLGGETYESNTIQIDSYTWLGIYTITETQGDAVFDPNTEGYVICEGAVSCTVGSPYTIVQWYKDGVLIQGATDPEYVITTPGVYYAVAAPGFCPNSTSTTLPIAVGMAPGCNTPFIEGDTMLCPNTEGTVSVINLTDYDSFQWYYRFGEEAFEEIEGATESSFTYDWETYDQAEFKVVAFLDGTPYESATIQIDSYNWAELTYSTTPSEDVVITPETNTYLLCDESTITNTVNSPYDTNIQWYRDGEPIEGATEQTFIITQPGAYYVVAAPAVCPDATASTSSTPLHVAMNPECEMGLENPEANGFSIYPNPANNVLNIIIPQNTIVSGYSIFDITGKVLANGQLGSQNTIDISGLSAGSYMVKLAGENTQMTKIFIKE